MSVAQVVLVIWTAGTVSAWPHHWLDPDLRARALTAFGPRATPWRIAVFEWATATIGAATWPAITILLVFRMARGR